MILSFKKIFQNNLLNTKIIIIIIIALHFEEHAVETASTIT